MKRFISLFLATSTGLLVMPDAAQAESVSASTQSAVRASSPTADTIALGNSTNGTALGRSRNVLETAFVFDLGALTLPINSATFSLDIRSAVGISLSGQSIGLFDAVTPASIFQTNQTVDSGPFEDLHLGKYGEKVVFSTDSLTRITFTLNDSALNDLRSALLTSSKLFVVGAALENLAPTGTHYFVVANASIATSTEVVNAVPEPLTAAFGLGLVCVALGARRRNRPAS